MKKEIRNVWIMKYDGTVLFHQGDEGKVNGFLVAGFISAVNVLASQIDDTGINKITFGHEKISMLKQDDLIFMVLHSKKMKVNRIEKILDNIASIFTSAYSSETIRNWAGNVLQFAQFGELISVLN